MINMILFDLWFRNDGALFNLLLKKDEKNGENKRMKMNGLAQRENIVMNMFAKCKFLMFKVFIYFFVFMDEAHCNYFRLPFTIIGFMQLHQATTQTIKSETILFYSSRSGESISFHFRRFIAH